MPDRPSNPRVAYVLLRAPTFSETFIPTEIRAVREAGALVEVFVARPLGGRWAEAVRVAKTVLRHPVRLYRHVRTLGSSDLPRAILAGSHAIALARKVSAFAPDIIHAHFVNLPTAVAVLVARELGKPVTAMAHAADFLLDRDRAGLVRRLRLLQHLFVVSAAAVKQLADQGVPMASIPYRIVRAAFDGGTPGPPASNASSTARLVTVARLVEKKGVTNAIDAVARLAKAGVNVRYDVYGDGPLRRLLEDRAEEQGVAGRVTFHGAVAHRVAISALEAADAAVLPCTRGADGDLDGIPVFLMEAASRQVPVVTTPVSGIPELTGEDGGWLVPPDDPAALADVIIRILRDPAEARRRSGILADRVRTEFSPGRQAERLLATWRQLIVSENRRSLADAGDVSVGERDSWT